MRDADVAMFESDIEPSAFNVMRRRVISNLVAMKHIRQPGRQARDKKRERPYSGPRRLSGSTTVLAEKSQLLTRGFWTGGQRCP